MLEAGAGGGGDGRVGLAVVVQEFVALVEEVGQVGLRRLQRVRVHVEALHHVVAEIVVGALRMSSSSQVPG